MSNCFLILDLNLEARILLLQGNSQIDSFSRLTTVDQFFLFSTMNIDTLYVNHSLERFFKPTDQKKQFSRNYSINARKAIKL